MLKTIAVASGLLCAYATSASAFKDEPKGFGKADFTMSVEQVQKVYPQMEPADPAKVEKIYTLNEMTNYTIADQKLDGFRDPATVTLRFSKDRFWLARAQISERDADSMVDALTKRYGPPTFGTTNPVWVSEKVFVSTMPNLQYFELTYRPISNESSGEFFRGKHGAHGHDSAAPPAGSAEEAPPAAAQKPAAPAAPAPADAK